MWAPPRAPAGGRCAPPAPPSGICRPSAGPAGAAPPNPRAARCGSEAPEPAYNLGTMATARAVKTRSNGKAHANGAAKKALPKIERHGLSDAQLIDLYRTMLRIRRFEERVKELFLEARLYGSVHLYI